jgi:hypothetical protein
LSIPAVLKSPSVDDKIRFHRQALRHESSFYTPSISSVFEVAQMAVARAVEIEQGYFIAFRDDLEI